MQFDVGQLVADFITKNGVPTAIIVFCMWFWVRHFWPFLTKEYWPQMNAREAQSRAILQTLAIAIAKLETVESMGTALLQEIQETSNDTNRRTRHIESDLITVIQELRTRSQGANPPITPKIPAEKPKPKPVRKAKPKKVEKKKEGTP